MKTTNIADHLFAMAEKHPHMPAVIFPETRDRQGRVAYTRYTYRQLAQRACHIALGLQQIGIGKGCSVVYMAKPSLDFFAMTFALFRVGAIPVLIDPGVGVGRIKRCIAEAEAEAFVGIPKAHLARKLLGWNRGRFRISVSIDGRSSLAGHDLSEILRLGREQAKRILFKSHGDANPSAPTTGAPTTDVSPAADAGLSPLLARLPKSLPDDRAAILFTSGSTGSPKGVIYHQRHFQAQVDLLKSAYGIKPGEVDLCTFPLFALFAPALGMTAVVPDMDFTKPGRVNPDRILEAIENFGVTNMFGSPALLKRVTGSAKDDHKTRGRIASLRRVISAGAPVPYQTLKRLRELLSPEADIHTPYGATEALPICTIESREIIDETSKVTAKGDGVCVGRPVPGVDVSVIAITDAPISQWQADLELPTGQIGEVIVRGPQVTAAYRNRPEANLKAKMKDPNSGEIIHRMGDLGYFDDQGRLWFCGRKAHRVATEKGDLYTVPCESLFNTHDRVARSALVGIPKGAYEEPVICIETNQDLAAEHKKATARELLALAQSKDETKDIRQVLYHKSFPVDVRHNSKIFREKLQVWATKNADRQGIRL